MPRWIHITKEFDFYWPDLSAVTHFHSEALGDQFVKDEIADFAIEKGYATEGKHDEASRSSKGKKPRRSRKKEAPSLETADTRSSAPVGDANAADADRAFDRPAVGDDAS
jgi:hypothetical protein